MPIQSAFTLNPNEIYASLGNMIISQQVFSNNLGKHQTLVDKARVDGSLFGDKKLFYATDVLSTHEWLGDSEAANLLALDRPDDPMVQAITLDVFRQIRLTLDQYLSKRPWMSGDSFNSFQSVMLGWMTETKKVYDGTTYNTFVGTHQTSIGKQMVEIDVTGARNNASTEEEANRLEAEVIAKDIADLIVDMGDYSRAYNDYGFMRSYSPESIKVIWNSAFVNKIRRVDLPTIFHKEGLIEKFEEEILPAKYFGTIITASNVASYSDATPAAGKPIDSDDGSYVPGVNHANGCIRAAVEKTVTVSAVEYHLFPGEEIPAGATIKASGDFELGEVYIEDAKVICKVLVEYAPYMSAFEVSSSWYNPRSLTETQYLTFGRNTLEALKNFPFITVKAK